jgi:hypothetical protein
MMKLHKKVSNCCHAKIIKYGSKRRQCTHCKRTWSIYPKKRGRKLIRVNSSNIATNLSSQESLRHKAQRLNKNRELIRRRHIRKIEQLLKTIPLSDPPDGKLISIVDGMHLCVNKIHYTLYVILLKSINSDEAVIMEPYLLKGCESIIGWRKVFYELSEDTRNRIYAVVSDGITGMNSLCKENKWVLQRCHFHFLKTLQSLRGKRWSTVVNRDMREDIYQSAKLLLTEKDEQKVKEIYVYLQKITRLDSCPKWIGRRVRGALRQWQDFRSYLKYSELNLPITSNSAESVMRLLADVKKQNRGFNNPQSFEKWAKTQLRIKKVIKCNGKKPTE